MKTIAMNLRRLSTRWIGRSAHDGNTNLRSGNLKSAFGGWLTHRARSARSTVAALFLLGGIAAVALELGALNAAPVAVNTEKNAPVVRVNVTNQPWDFVHPWTKHAPYSRRALGIVLKGKKVLVTAELVANANYLELEKAESGEKVAATVEVVDYEANLALLKTNDEKFFSGMKPVELTDAVVGDHVSTWQLETTGALLITGAIVTTVEVSRYPIDDTALLIYRLTSSLQYRENSFTLPIMKGDKLVGMLMRYDARTQNVDAIPTPVIEHFLKDAADSVYSGFPRAGLQFSPMRDPQLRRYAGLNGGQPGGVYVTDVQKDGPADKAGIQTGDVLLAVGDKPIDQDGLYVDKLYGKVALSHLISTKGHTGDAVKLKLFRKGETKEVELTLAHRPAGDYVIEPFTIDKAPRFLVLGGLVFQELSRQYLKEWSDWQKKAPERFVYYDRFQSELFGDDRKRIIILSQVMPNTNTIGYEDLNNLVVTKINDVPLKTFADVSAAIEKPVDGFHKIEFEDNPRVIYLDAKQVEKDEPALMKSYGLPTIKRTE